MERLFDVVQDRRGNAIQSAVVTVRDDTGSAATIFSDDGVTTVANPLTTNVDGEYTFFAKNGQYSTEIVATGYATETIDNRTLYDPADAKGRTIVRTISTAAYSITAGNFGEWLDIDTAGTAVVSLPDQTAVASWNASLSEGGGVIVRQKGAGQLQIAPSGSATAVAASSLHARARYSVMAAQCVGTSTWSVFGDTQ